MVDKGHCKIAFSGGDAIAEFADFYDYSSTYPEAEGDHQENDHDVDMGKNSFNKKKVFFNFFCRFLNPNSFFQFEF